MPQWLGGGGGVKGRPVSEALADCWCIAEAHAPAARAALLLAPRQAGSRPAAAAGRSSCLHPSSCLPATFMSCFHTLALPSQVMVHTSPPSVS